MIFSCGENNKEDKESLEYRIERLKEKEERTVHCFLWDSDYYNYQKIDGYKEFKSKILSYQLSFHCVSDRFLLDINSKIVAVRKGFEPPKQFPVYTLSKRAP
jgi:CRISPR/Cas system-associated endonuclease/helicase Cas3